MSFKKASLLYAAVFSVAAFSVQCTETEKSGSDGIPEATIKAATVNDEPTVTIAIPADHHAYLDKGPQGNLIPVAFDWKPALESGKVKAEPELQSSPEGQKEEATGALVMRGTGEFVFSGGEIETGAQIRVRTQICNEISGMCFRPSWQTVNVQ